MSQIYHNNAVTNSHTRSYIQSATESVADLALKHRTSEKTIIKWQKRDFINDKSSRPRQRRHSLIYSNRDLRSKI